MYINRVFIFGNLTRDPDLRVLPGGMPIATFAIATNRMYKKTDGTKAEEVEYHNVTVFGRQAESCAQYLRKGSTAFVEGRIKTGSWDKDGAKHHRTDIVAERVQFGSRAAPKVGEDIDQRPVDERAPEATTGGDTGNEYPQEDINPDDIPF